MTIHSSVLTGFTEQSFNTFGLQIRDLSVIFLKYGNLYVPFVYAKVKLDSLRQYYWFCSCDSLKQHFVTLFYLFNSRCNQFLVSNFHFILVKYEQYCRFGSDKLLLRQIFLFKQQIVKYNSFDTKLRQYFYLGKGTIFPNCR